jgi:hypothetical protein
MLEWTELFARAPSLLDLIGLALGKYQGSTGQVLSNLIHQNAVHTFMHESLSLCVRQHNPKTTVDHEFHEDLLLATGFSSRNFE